MPRRILQGKVVSTKSAKTAVVRVERAMKHPLYAKTIRTSKKYHAHDPEGVCQIGQNVRIIECPPVSKLKRFMVLPPQNDTTTEVKE